MDLLPISQIKKGAQEGRLDARVHGQIESLTRKDTREGKPYFELVLTDGEGKLSLKAWNDAPAFAFCDRASVGLFIEVTGDFGVSGNFENFELGDTVP